MKFLILKLQDGRTIFLNAGQIQYFEASKGDGSPATVFMSNGQVFPLTITVDELIDKIRGSVRPFKDMTAADLPVADAKEFPPIEI